MTSFNTEQNKLENAQKHLERCQQTIIGQLKKCEGDEFQQILQLFQLSRLAYAEAASKLEVREVLDKLKYVRKAVVVECGSNIPDLKLFQEDLTNIIAAVQDMKVHSKLKIEELQSEESRLHDDIKIYNERVCYWSEPIKLDFLKSERYKKIDSSSRVPEDVEKFMDFIKISNGHENGWSVSDNQLFLKLRKKYKNVDEVALNLNKILPDIKIEDVKIHEEWYTKYLKLKERHDAAIKNWKKRKEEIKATDLDVVNPCAKSEILKNSVHSMKTLNEKHLEKNKIKEEIENWKKQREAAKRINKELMAEGSEQKKKKENQREKMNRFKKSEMVMKWKAKKISLAEDRQNSEKTKNEMEHNVRVAVANKMIKLYQMQDKILLQKKKLSQTDKGEKIPEQKPKSCREVDRDPKRLFRPTQQWINRFLANNGSASMRPVNFIKEIPKLQIPSWRKNL